MIYPGFIGPSYKSRSLIADAEECVNLYPERIESGAGKNDIVLYGTPGAFRLGFHPPDGTYLTLPGEIMAMKSVWSVANGGYSSYVVTTSTQVGSASRTISLCTPINFGTVASYTFPGTGAYPPRAAWMASNGTQLLVLLKLDGGSPGNTSGSLLLCYTFKTGAFTVVSTWDNTQCPTGLDFLDGFFIISTVQSLFVSGQGDGTSWNAANFINISDEPDSIVGMLVQQRLIWVFGKNRIETYYNAGGTDFPFQRVPQGVIETGALCMAGIVPLGDGSIMWVGLDQRGGVTVWRNQGYNAVRVSTHAIENILAPYFTSADVVNPNGGVSAYGGAPAAWMGLRAYVYREDGHLFYMLNLGGPNTSGTSIFGFATPTPATTPVYDATSGLWHERRSFDGTGNTRHLGNFYCFDANVGGHIVSDYRKPWLYLLQNSTYTEYNATPITRWRTAPHLATENKLNFYSKFTLDCEVGTEAVTQSITLQWSNDGGQTWSDGITLNAYTATQGYLARFIWRRLGAARDRVFKLSTSDAMPVAWINAYLELTTGNS